MSTILTPEVISEFQKIALPLGPMERMMARAERVPTFMRTPEQRFTKETISKMEPTPQTTQAVPKTRLIKKVVPATKAVGKGLLGAAGLGGLALLGGAAAGAVSGQNSYYE